MTKLLRQETKKEQSFSTNIYGFPDDVFRILKLNLIILIKAAPVVHGFKINFNISATCKSQRIYVKQVDIVYFDV